MKTETNEPKPHFVYAGYYHWYPEERLGSSILEGMKKYKIKTAMVTIIHMRRYRLISNNKLLQKNIWRIIAKGKKMRKIRSMMTWNHSLKIYKMEKSQITKLGLIFCRNCRGKNWNWSKEKIQNISKIFGFHIQM